MSRAWGCAHSFAREARPVARVGPVIVDRDPGLDGLDRAIDGMAIPRKCGNLSSRLVVGQYIRDVPLELGRGASLPESDATKNRTRTVPTLV